MVAPRGRGEICMHDVDIDDDTVQAVPVPRADLHPGVAIDPDVIDGETIMRGRVRAPARPAPAPAAEDPQGDQPAAPAGSLPPVPAALRPRHLLRIGSAEVELDRPVIVGRNPRHSRVPSPLRPHLIPVESPERWISSRHIELREHGGGVVATDMRSLNGSTLHLPSGEVVSLRRGESVVVLPGTRIDLGEGVVLEVLAPDPSRRRR